MSSSFDRTRHGPRTIRTRLNSRVHSLPSTLHSSSTTRMARSHGRRDRTDSNSSSSSFASTNTPSPSRLAQSSTRRSTTVQMSLADAENKGRRRLSISSDSSELDEKRGLVDCIRSDTRQMGSMSESGIGRSDGSRRKKYRSKTFTMRSPAKTAVCRLFLSIAFDLCLAELVECCHQTASKRKQ